MGIKSALAKPLAAYAFSKQMKAANRAVEAQQKVFETLIKSAIDTVFGRDHHFKSIKTHTDFVKAVPLNDYEGLATYIQRVKAGEQDVLWPGHPIYLCKTSGTTSGTKYIPISKESISNHISSAKNALFAYMYRSGNTAFVDGKMIFLQGSPVLETHNNIPIGRLSGIVAHHVPAYLQTNRLPSWEVNCIEDWETKVDKIVAETATQDLRLISGIPSWIQMYFERLLAYTGKKTVKEVFPNFSVYVFGGVNYAPYKTIFDSLIGAPIHTVETYPASEGFIAYQDDYLNEGLLLVVDNGIFYEFVKPEEIGTSNPTRLTLDAVELGVNYAIVLNTNAGLWGYVIGDTVKFVSLDPYRIVVTGRIKHFTSAFGEHVIAEEVEFAMQEASKQTGALVAEFHVAPQITPEPGQLPYHEWFVEFVEQPADVERFAQLLDQVMQAKNSYYKDLITGSILRRLVISSVEKGAFQAYMKGIGKLGGQNKLPRLANDRALADKLQDYKITSF